MRKNNSLTYLITVILLWLDYDQTLMHFPLMQSRNAASLTTFNPVDSTQFLLGDTRLTMSTAHGHLAAAHVAPHAWNAQAQVRSIYRMSRRVVVKGSMDYSYGWGKNAGGSVWIAPERMPFDITETDDSTRGKISLECYHLNSGLGVEVGHGVSLGATFDYTTASGAKKKDPRHVNSLMNCEVGMGLTWHVKGLTIGGNYLFGRTTEGLKFSTFGRTDRVYHYLIDHGAYFGREESTDGNGYVSDDNELPLLDIRHGLSALATYQHGAWAWGIEGGWTHRHGHYGLESPSMIDFNRHSGDAWDIRSWWQHDDGTSLQRVSLSYSHQGVKDHERTYRIITDHGVTDTRYYDDRLMGKHQYNVLAASADLRWGIKRQLATWQLQATLTHNRRNITASLYPFYRQQLTRLTEFTLQGTRNWLMANDQVWSQYTLYLMRQYEYQTARRLLAAAQVRWSIPVAHLRLYAEAGYSYRQAFNIDYLENGYRHQAALAVGCLF